MTKINIQFKTFFVFGHLTLGCKTLLLLNHLTTMIPAPDIIKIFCDLIPTWKHIVIYNIKRDQVQISGKLSIRLQITN